jgi:phage terminase large subunit
MEIFEISTELAKFFVFHCQTKNYVEMIDQFRYASTRHSLVESMIQLLEHSEYNPAFPTTLTDEYWKKFVDFILYADIEKVKRLHTAMIYHISAFELEKMYVTEVYLQQLLEND